MWLRRFGKSCTVEFGEALVSWCFTNSTGLDLLASQPHTMSGLGFPGYGHDRVEDLIKVYEDLLIYVKERPQTAEKLDRELGCFDNDA